MQRPIDKLPGADGFDGAVVEGVVVDGGVVDGNVSSTENRPPASATIFVVPFALWALAVASASA
jgi:hypothetical protein